jgi:transcriptional regulator with XRE-family HTH domain
MTLREVAMPAGVSIAYLSDLERGVLENPTLDKLRGIAGALNISLNELLAVPEPRQSRRAQRAPGLKELAASESFLSATAEQAKWLRRDPDDLRNEWLGLLENLQIAGRRPATTSDYMFIFEAIRRAVEGR